MTMKVKIDRVVVDMAAGQRVDPVTLKTAIELRLAAMIGSLNQWTPSGAPTKALTSHASMGLVGLHGEARFAHTVAADICEAMKR